MEIAKCRARRLLPLVGLLVAALPGAGIAQDEYEQAPDLHALEDLPTEAPSRDIPIDIRLRSATRFAVDSDFGAADADLYWPRGSLRVAFPLSKRAAMRFRINGGAAFYDFHGTHDLRGAGPSQRDPFDTLYSGAFALEGAYRVNDTWGLFAQAFLTSNWEDGASFDDALSGGGGFAVGYRIRDRLDLILGVGLRSRLDRSGPRLYPLIDLEWNIDDHWKLISHGQGLALVYAFDDDFSVFVRGRLESRRYRLDVHPGPASRGTVRDRQVPVGLGFRWAASRHFSVRAVAGVMAYHQLKVRDDDRVTIASVSADPAPFFEVFIDLRP